MGKRSYSIVYFCLLISLVVVATEAQVHAQGFNKLFVFGDSYVDTGNRNFSARSWRQPYGITFPGTPAGHYSDGLVFSDYIASGMGLRSPVPFRWRKLVPREFLEYGMNFAYGGTGVFQTLVSAPNMTVQINFFQRQLNEKVYTKADLNSSVALVSLAGNDYTAYVVRNGTTGLSAFTRAVIKQLGLNLKRIQSLGVKKIAVMAIEPLGCLPSETIYYSYENCSADGNAVALYHNQLLEETVKQLNNESKESVFVIIDIYNAFLMVLNQTGASQFKDPLRPCCQAVSSDYKCGVVENGEKKYTLCNNPNSTFFWDDCHPTQVGWQAIYSVLKSSTYSYSLTEMISSRERNYYAS